MFVGRKRELAALDGVLDQVARGIGDNTPGRCILMRGRRRIGKSMLAEEFIQRAHRPAMFFTASGGTPQDHLQQLIRDVAVSTLPDRVQFAEASPGDWSTALESLAAIIPTDETSIVVIDEVPFLMRDVNAFEGFLQRAWDRFLSRRPVLLLLIGSDISMMEALNSYERPFHQRGTEMVVGPLNPAEVGSMLRLDPPEAFDAAVITGGLPQVCQEWPIGASPEQYLTQALSDPLSALVVSGERSLGAEFSPAAQARRVLSAVGQGERSFSNIARAAGNLANSSLKNAIDVLVDKRLLSSERPLSTRPSRDRRYMIADPYLRFWLAFVEPNLSELDRQRSDLVMRRINRSWSSWRGKVIEPLVRDALWRLLPDEQVDVEPGAVGSYWTRTNDVEIDIVVADRAPIAKQLRLIGSIKWRDDATFDVRDLHALHHHSLALTDKVVPLIAVSRCGASTGGLDAVYDPETLIAAWG